MTFTFIQTVMLYFSFAVSVLFLVAGGWVKVRDWFKTRAATKAAAVEAEIQARVKEQLATVTEAAEKTDQTATSTTGDTTATVATA